MTRRLGLALACGVVVLAMGSIARADRLEDAWAKGKDATLRGDYATAVAAFEQIEAEHVVSPELAFNLGNAYYRRGQLGHAVWAWERAVALDPGYDDARANLGQARRAAARRVHDRLEGADREPAWIRAVTALGVSTETWLFLALYFAFFAVLGLRLRARRAGTLDDGPAWGALAVLLGAAAGLAGMLLVGRAALDRVPFAIVLPDAVQVKEGANPDYRTSFELHAGLKVRVVDRDQDWVRVRLANGLEGWVRAREVGPL